MWTPQQVAQFQMYVLEQKQLHQLAVANQVNMLPPHMAFGNNLMTADNGQQEELDVDDETLRTLYCGNLDERVTEEMLYEVFLQAGPIESVRIPKDRTFGFVHYVHLSAPIYAMHLLQGLELFRKRVIIKFCNSDKLPPSNRFTLPVGLEELFGNRNHQQIKEHAASGNPFTQDLRNMIDRRGRNSYHDLKPYDRHQQRRSDGALDRGRDRDRERNHHRRSDQRSGGYRR